MSESVILREDGGQSKKTSNQDVVCYSTKFCLRSGILKYCLDRSKSKYDSGDENLYWNTLDDYHQTFEEAVERAEQLRNDEITALKKRLSEVKALKFDTSTTMGLTGE